MTNGSTLVSERNRSRDAIPPRRNVTLVERDDDFAGLGVGAEVLVSGNVFSQAGENAIDSGLENS